MNPQSPILNYQRLNPHDHRDARRRDHLFRAALLLVTGFFSFWLFMVLNIPLYREVFSPKWERTLGVALVVIGISSLICGAVISGKRRWFLAAFLFGGGFATPPYTACFSLWPATSRGHENLMFTTYASE